MYKEAILENENRRRIYSLIDTHQGIHLRELQRLLDIPLATLEYHLSYMSRKKIIYGEKEEQFRRYYTKPLDPQDKKILTVLRQKKMREIVLGSNFNGASKISVNSRKLEASLFHAFVLSQIFSGKGRP